jgi:diguanylate cyclase (GGDEF)-like protein
MTIIVKTPLPKNETTRLQVLQDYGILDTLEEQTFNDLTRLASLICETPIALVSLVDSDRQWFKSHVGLQATQTPREHAFCAHAILHPNDVMVVNDAHTDPRFADNPLVTQDPHIRFYAGAPLVAPGGEAMGTICVIDSTPRNLPAEKAEALQALSRLVVAQMELRRVIGEVDQNAAELRAHLLRLERTQVQLRAANAGLEVMSLTDGLTGVKNRRAFDQALQQEIARANREKTLVSLLVIDIDNFKGYNDSFGHVAGDEALQKVAQTLAARGRPSDVVARYGGEEFAVILPHTNAYNAVVVAERLRRAIEDLPWTHRLITVSIGASTTTDELDSKMMTDRADRALYWMKQAGGNQVAHADQYLSEKDQGSQLPG